MHIYMCHNYAIFKLNQFANRIHLLLFFVVTQSVPHLHLHSLICRVNYAIINMSCKFVTIYWQTLRISLAKRIASNIEQIQINYAKDRLINLRGFFLGCDFDFAAILPTVDNMQRM